MDITIRNLDERAYRALKARAALAGKTIGEVLNEAIRIYVAPESAERIAEAISAIGSLDDDEADRLRESVRTLRETWR